MKTHSNRFEVIESACQRAIEIVKPLPLDSEVRFRLDATRKALALFGKEK